MDGSIICRCDFKFPTIAFFGEEGIFSHIKLPIGPEEVIPEEIIEYIHSNIHQLRPSKTQLEYIRNQLNLLPHMPLCVCSEGGECNFRLPSIDFFQPGGIFSHVKLPLGPDDDVPDEVLQFIYGAHWDEGGNVKLSHPANIKSSLNHLLTPDEPEPYMKNVDIPIAGDDYTFIL